MKHERTELPTDSKLIQALLRLLIKLGVVCAVVFLLLHFVFGVFVVHTNDMYPAVRDGDLCITYRLASYGYDRIITYHHEGSTHFGRIVALPGDVVDMDEAGHYTINGDEPFETIYYETMSIAGSEVTFPYTVGEGEVFVLNDLRENGKDSRTFGAIQTSEADGVIVLLLRRRSW